MSETWDKLDDILARYVAVGIDPAPLKLIIRKRLAAAFFVGLGEGALCVILGLVLGLW
jgi:hypothetical protein